MTAGPTTAAPSRVPSIPSISTPTVAPPSSPKPATSPDRARPSKAGPPAHSSTRRTRPRPPPRRGRPPRRRACRAISAWMAAAPSVASRKAAWTADAVSGLDALADLRPGIERDRSPRSHPGGSRCELPHPGLERELGLRPQGGELVLETDRPRGVGLRERRQPGADLAQLLGLTLGLGWMLEGRELGGDRRPQLVDGRQELGDRGRPRAGASPLDGVADEGFGEARDAALIDQALVGQLASPPRRRTELSPNGASSIPRPPR